MNTLQADQVSDFISSQSAATQALAAAIFLVWLFFK